MRKYLLALTLLITPLLGGYFAFFQSSSSFYYISSAGNDSADGHSPATAWRTLAKVNTVAAASGFHAGDSILLRRGDVWHEQMTLGSRYNSTPSSTLASNPPTFTGAAGAPIVIDAYGIGRKPLIDSADVISNPTTLFDAATGTYTMPATVKGMPGKLYYNGQFFDTTQLLPVPNYSGECNNAVAYQPLDLVTCTTYTVGTANGTLTEPYVNIHGMGGTTTGVPTSDETVWVPNINNANFYGCNPACATGQYFNIYNSGPQNVKENPGSWWYDSDANLFYIHLKDGSDPANGVLSGTYRKYGIELLSANYVTIQNIAIEHSQKSCILAMAYSNNQGGNYRTNENIAINHNDAWNCGDSVRDSETMQTGSNVLNGGIVVRADNSGDPVLLNGVNVTRNDIGTNDSYFGLRNQSYSAGIEVAGITGDVSGGIIGNNRVRTHNNRGIVSNLVGLGAPSTLLETNTQVVYNDLKDNQGNIFFGFKRGGIVGWNYIHDYYGEGIQWGGNSIGTTSVPLIGKYNLIVHGYISADATLYNGSDCNGNGYGLQLRHNSVYDPWGSDFSMEGGCGGGTIVDNAFVNQGSQFPGYSQTNSSFFFYYVAASRDSATTVGYNYYLNGTSPNPFHTTTVSYNTSNYPAGWPDSTSIMGTSMPYKNAGPGIYGRDYSLAVGSSAIGAASDGTNIGAYDGTANSFNMALVGPEAGMTLSAFTGTKY